jgi:phasin family protein
MAAKKKTTTETAEKALEPVEAVVAAGRESVEAAVAVGRESVEAAVKVGKENLDAAVKVGTEAATKSYEQAVAKTKEQVEQAVTLTKENVDKASEAAFKGYDDLAVLGKDTFDALVLTNTIMAKGMEVFGKEVLAYTQASMEDNVAQTKALMGVKSLKELVDLQNDFARARFDRAVAETAKLTDLSVQTANEAMGPLQKRVDVTVETLLKAQAA